jgi:hypothetical protein
VDLFETCEITLTPGIIDTQAPEKIISVLNCGDQHVTIYPNMKLGTFLSRGKVSYNQSLIHTSKGNLGLVFPQEGCRILKHCVQKFYHKTKFSFELYRMV